MATRLNEHCDTHILHTHIHITIIIHIRIRTRARTTNAANAAAMAMAVVLAVVVVVAVASWLGSMRTSWHVERGHEDEGHEEEEEWCTLEPCLERELGGAMRPGAGVRAPSGARVS